MLEVLAGGLQTTVQDLGRPGFLRTGLPPSGAFDTFALRAGNLLVGNRVGGPYLISRDQADAGLEILLGGFRCRALADHVIAVTGGDLAATVNGQPIPMWQAVLLRAGDELAFGMSRLGARAYLAVAGGIDLPLYLGSRATNVRAGVGGLEGRALKPGDRLPVGRPSADPAALVGRAWRPELRPRLGQPWTLRVVLGPQDDLFLPESVDLFLSADWKLSATSDRMGCRFIGPRLGFKPRPDYLVEQAGADPSNIVDDATPVGGIQVPSGVEPIVMGPDVPSIGGYAKIGAVILSDLPVLAQVRPGETVHFRAISVDEGAEVMRQQEALLTEENVIAALSR